MIASMQGLKKKFRQLQVLDGIDLQLKAAEIVCLLGPSGSGKTTLLNLIAGLQAADGGLCQVNGKVSYVFQEERLLPWQNVLENVLFPDERREVSLAKTILEKLGLSDFINYYPEQLSGGMKQRVSIARAFYAEHELLLMDEPFQSLDVDLRLKMIKELIALWEVRKNSILFVTHNLEEAFLLGHRIVVLSAIPSKIKREFTLNKAFSERLPEDFKDMKREIETLLKASSN